MLRSMGSQRVGHDLVTELIMMVTALNSAFSLVHVYVSHRSKENFQIEAEEQNDREIHQ